MENPGETRFLPTIRHRALGLCAVGLAVLTVFALAAVPSSAAQGLEEESTGHDVAITGPPLATTRSKLSEHEREYILSADAQEQAERLIQAAINHDEGATELIAQLVPNWYGHVAFTKSWNDLEALAMASKDVRVRAVAIETHLAMANVPQKSESVTHLINAADKTPMNRPHYAHLLGMLGNRGVEAERIREWLLTWARESGLAGAAAAEGPEGPRAALEDQARIAVVQALALIAAEEDMHELLTMLREDPSPRVRRQVLRSIGRTGMFTQSQRWHAIPPLLDLTLDPAVDDLTRHQVFDCLRDISGASLPDDSNSWQTWFYEDSRKRSGS
jgi:HEAT repeat protein